MTHPNSPSTMSRLLLAQGGPLAHRPVAVIYSPDSSLPRKVTTDVAVAWSSRAAAPTQSARKPQVKRLGWDVWMESAEVLFDSVVEALKTLDMSYDVPAPHTGQLSMITRPRNISEEMGLGVVQATITVLPLTSPTSASNYRIDVSRFAGDTFQFHAFYRQLRAGLKGITGWDGAAYRSTCNRPEPAAANAEPVAVS